MCISYPLGNHVEFPVGVHALCGWNRQSFLLSLPIHFGRVFPWERDLEFLKSWSLAGSENMITEFSTYHRVKQHQLRDDLCIGTKKQKDKPFLFAHTLVMSCAMLGSFLCFSLLQSSFNLHLEELRGHIISQLYLARFSLIVTGTLVFHSPPLTETSNTDLRTHKKNKQSYARLQK